MPSRYDVLGALPVFKNQAEVWNSNQTTDDIIDGILKCHDLDKDQYDMISDKFIGKTVRQTAENVFRFEKKNIPYHVEGIDKQTVRVPAGIVSMPGDCKNYALFANGIFDSLNRKGVMKVPIAYRFASYDLFDPEPKHVFSVLYPGTENEIWVDPVLTSFDERKEPSFYKDFKIKPMALVRISGVANPVKPLSTSDKIALLKAHRDGLIQERTDMLNTGNMKMLSARDQEYKQGIEMFNDQIKNGGIGFIDPVTLSAGLSVITSLFGKHDNGPGYLGWDRLDVQRGNGLGASAADTVYNKRTDVPMSDLLSWLQSRPDSLQLLLNNRKYGTITVDMLADYFALRGYPNEAEQFRHQVATTNTSGQVVATGEKKDNTMLFVIGGAAALYLLTKKKGR